LRTNGGRCSIRAFPPASFVDRRSVTALSRQIERLVRAGAEVTPRQREEIARSVAAITGRGAALSTELQAATQRTAQVRDLQTELRTIATERR
jgi:hypothetical protein